MNNHNIKISNFSNAETVTYPIIKLTGSVQFDANIFCGISKDKRVILHQNDQNTSTSSDLVDNNFKFLVQLSNGKNLITVQYCCESVSVVLEYFPVVSENSVIPLYVICEDHDGCFQAPAWESNTVESACRRISLASKLLQCVTAEKLYEHGLGRKTFGLDGDCRVFRSSTSTQQARNMGQMELWESVGREIMKSSFASECKKYLAFLSCTKYREDKYDEDIIKTHDDLISITDGYVALGGGGLALFGTACLYTWPENFDDIIAKFEDTTPVNRNQFLDDSCYRGTLGGCFSTTLGSVLHELFHTFDLGHTEDGIMGRGFDNIYKVFTLSNKSGDNPSAFPVKIEFKEEFEADSLVERLKTENKKKEFTVIRKFEDVDDTVLSRSCAVILCYHKWFNQTPKQSSLLSFDPSNKLIKSTSGIRVVEVRSIDRELVLNSWVFDGRILKFSFQLPRIEVADENCLIFVEDTVGCILKEKFKTDRF
ncbi:unnamed protein product [Phyllotreta striolata]|uniref:Zinc metalloproteinase YIL108W n=1 Tax=Phyllotreta striolata TaxID=444603 RepID=A0A9N9XQL2_PHYSR|nr:unnamed protein product [Phyllotreta striolata]